MSQNVEVAQVGYDAWTEDDLDAWLTVLHEEVEMWTSGVFPGLDPVYRGHAGMEKFWGDFRSPWQSLRMVIDSYRERGDQVVALYRFEATARDELPVQREAANVLTFRGGVVTRIDSYGSWVEGLAAVGLSEQDAHADS